MCNSYTETAVSGFCADNGVRIIEIRKNSSIEYSITVSQTPEDDIRSMMHKAAGALKQTDAGVIAQQVFAPPVPEYASVMHDAFGDIRWPVTWVGSRKAESPAGIHIWAISGVDIEPLVVDGEAAGTVFEDSGLRYCVLGGIQSDLGRSDIGQASDVFNKLQFALDKAGMNFSNVIRTWFYNDDILSWYPEFNGVRNDFFAGQDVFGGLVPASTGIGACNPNGTAVVSGLIAVHPVSGDITACAVPSPLQCSAIDYGSSFSRAVELAAPGYRRLFISGTASIEPDGKTAHEGNIESQIDLTMRVVAAILESRQMGWADVVRSTAYVTDAETARAYGDYCSSNGIDNMPLAVIIDDVCRGDLLFEIELDAYIRV